MKKGVSGHAGIIIEGELHPRLGSVNQVHRGKLI